jgi:hypothetical protein
VLAVIISFGGKEGLDRWTPRMSELFALYASGREGKSALIA